MEVKKTTTQLWDILNQSSDIDEYMDENKDEMIDLKLSAYLNELLEENGLSKAEVFKKSNIQQSYGYHLFAGTKTNPSRNHLLQLSFGMGLDLIHTQRLLRIAGLSELYPRSKRDGIIIFCINNSYTLEECFEMLEKNDCEPIYSI